MYGEARTGMGRETMEGSVLTEFQLLLHGSLPSTYSCIHGLAYCRVSLCLLLPIVTYMDREGGDTLTRFHPLLHGLSFPFTSASTC